MKYTHRPRRDRLPTLHGAHCAVSSARTIWQAVLSRNAGHGAIAWLESQGAACLWLALDSGDLRILSLDVRPDPSAVEVSQHAGRAIVATMLNEPGVRACNWPAEGQE